MRKSILLFCILTGLACSINAQISFKSNEQQITSTNSWEVHLVDLNGDSVPDAYFDNKIWLNDGNGSFYETVTKLGTGDYSDFADFNRDGYIDFVSQDSIFLNDSSYNFIFSKKLESSFDMLRPIIGDVDNDGDNDIISCSESTDVLFINDGNGNFTNSSISFGGWSQANYAMGDINGDGFTDIYVAIPHNPPPPPFNYKPDRIYFGNEQGNFSYITFDISGFQSRDVILADFNNDGSLDLFIVKGYGSGSSKLFFNDGVGNFTDSGQKINQGYDSPDAQAADLDNDEDLDIVIANGMPGATSKPNTIWLNDGEGIFTDSELQLGNSNTIMVDIADINSDGKEDIIGVNLDFNTNSVPVEIWLNITFYSNYLNEIKPGNIPLLFGSGTVSVDNENTHALNFHPEGKALIFSRYPERKSYIMYFNDSIWTQPVEVPFEGKEVCFSSDGKCVYFYHDGEIYRFPFPFNGTDVAEKLPSAINTGEMEYFPCITKNNNIFFSRNGNWSNAKIYFSEYINNSWQQAVELDSKINSGGASHAYISPDEDYILFNSPREGSYTENDIWVSFKTEDGTWINPINAGDTINSEAEAILCPTVSPDGKFLFFTKYNNGLGNIYWVSTSFIYNLKEQVTTVNSQKKENSAIKIFPNPCNDIITLANTGSFNDNIKYELTDLNGRIIKSGQINSNQISLSGLHPGCYYLSYKLSNEIYLGKIIKQ